MLQESSGPSDQVVPNCLAHIVMLTEKINFLRHCANEGHQVRCNDPMHILDVSLDEEEEVCEGNTETRPLVYRDSLRQG